MRSAATNALERGYDPRQVVTDGSVVGSGGALLSIARDGLRESKQKGCGVATAKEGPL